MITSLSKFIRLIILILIIVSCNKNKCKHLKITNLGTAQFRISYSSLVGLTDHELDSVPPLKPEFDLLFNNPKPELLKYLNALGFVEKNILQINKVDTLLTDTVTISSSSKEDFYLFASLDLRSEKTYLNITNGKCRDSLYLDNSLNRPSFRVLQPKNTSKRLLLIYWKFYFMNGDMFDISLFEIP